MSWIKTLDFIKFYQNYYKTIIENLIGEMEGMPEGSLVCKQTNSYLRLFHSFKTPNGIRQLNYLKNDDNEIKKKLCRKQFILDSIGQLKKSLNSIDRFLNTFTPYDPTEILSEYPIPFAAMCDVNTTMTKSETDWCNALYDKNESFPEGLMHWTANGLRVRSKSESIIATLLEKEKIPFRYEAALKILGKTYYPDFTIIRPKDKMIIYWEHFGMMDNDMYRQSMNRKMTDYAESNIFPWDQLITTFETKDSPIDARNLQKIINVFILD